MRRARVKEDADEKEGVYHLISRTVNGERMLGTTAKEILRRQMWQVAEFAGLEILTFAILSNHFHILVRVPKRPALDDAELLRRYAVLYPKPTSYQTACLAVVKQQLAANGPEAQAWRKRQLSLMYDISTYMKLVKERFSIWYNRSHRRFGPVWSDRFRSLVVEPQGWTIRAMAAYIDLNCVRAGIARDPKEYRFCGYAEAVAGNAAARRGLGSIIGGDWADAGPAYRLLLFTKGAAASQKGARIDSQRMQEVLDRGGELSLPEVLRCRIRHFSEGVVLGSVAFVDEHVGHYRRRFGCGQRVRARPLAAFAAWAEIAGLRAVRGSLLG